MKSYLRDLIWILPVSLGAGGLLSTLSPGLWWIGWLGYSLILIPGLFSLAALWRWAGEGRTLGVMLLLAFLLRLGLGVALTYLLPAYGTGSRLQNAGYVFADAYVRDHQAWALARSHLSIWKAFDKSYSTDQYGGLLALEAGLYRYISPDAQRPWLLVLLAALSAAVGVAFAWKAMRQLWGDSLVLPAAWILVLYPESILLGSSQMREPFLITFMIVLFWGIIDWQYNHHRLAWLWMGGSLAGMLLVQPGMVFALPVLGVWAWFRGRERKLPWRSLLIIALVLLLAIVVLSFSLAHNGTIITSPATILTSWLQLTAKWNTFVLEQKSGWLERVFHDLPKSLELPFMTAYGIAQPILPAAIANPSTWLWGTLNTLLAAGWYALLPFLAVSLVAVWRIPEKEERRAWIWLWIITWVWIMIASFRAGGTQWDSPRYRSWFLLLQAVLASKALLWWRETHNPWMGRILAVEAVFLTFFGFWYASRYGSWGMHPLHVFTIIAATAAVGALILIGGWVADFIHKRAGKGT